MEGRGGESHSVFTDKARALFLALKYGGMDAPTYIKEMERSVFTDIPAPTLLRVVSEETRTWLVITKAWLKSEIHARLVALGREIYTLGEQSENNYRFWGIVLGLLSTREQRMWYSHFTKNERQFRSTTPRYPPSLYRPNAHAKIVVADGSKMRHAISEEEFNAYMAEVETLALRVREIVADPATHAQYQQSRHIVPAPEPVWADEDDAREEEWPQIEPEAIP